MSRRQYLGASLGAVLLAAAETACGSRRHRGTRAPEHTTSTTSARPTAAPVEADVEPPSLADLYALRSGPAPMGADQCALTVHDIGPLTVLSGRVEASDPFVNLGQGLVVSVPAGQAPVFLTVAEVPYSNGHTELRNAYLSLILGEEPPLTVEYVTPEGKPPAPPGKIYGLSVDAGLAGFVDTQAVAEIPDDLYNTVLDTGHPGAWIDIFSKDPRIPKYANTIVPFAPAHQNIVFCESGWGDGFYPLLATRAADGRMTALHLDFGVVYRD